MPRVRSRQASQEKENSAPAISKIEVRGLFGYLSYNISPERKLRSSDVLILYGENGSGKTTLLSLLFYVLSPLDKRGHKTVVARTVFSRFSVYFDNGAEVTALRPSGSFTGTYTMIVTSPPATPRSFDFQPDNEGSIRPETDPVRQKEYADFLRALAATGSALFFLKDDRSMESTLFRDRHEVDVHDVLAGASIRQQLDASTITIEAVRIAVNRASHWIRAQGFRAATRGETDTYNIYLGIVRRVAGRTAKKEVKKLGTLANARRKLKEIAKRSDRFARLGLIPRVDITEMSQLIIKTKAQVSAVVEQVVWPYIETMTARFDALERIGSALEKFLFYLNKFFRDKHIGFDLRDGLVIYTGRGQRLQPEMLSSGERHLLLLFCNVLVAEEQPSLFIIDEPELSLNVRWQRLLINALVDCVKQSQVRFVLATHSTEMLAQHRQFVQQLKPLPVAENGGRVMETPQTVESS
jgi:energy-coupling factor transporter ATP-binding protein EcfA2